MELGYEPSQKYGERMRVYDDLPSGCSIRNGGDMKPHMGQQDGFGDLCPDLIPICKKTGNSSKSYYKICLMGKYLLTH